MIPVIVVFAYLAVVAGIGLVAFKKSQSNTEDFFLASRTIGPMVFFLSLFATNMTAFAILGSSGQAYRQGIGIYGLMTKPSTRKSLCPGDTPGRSCRESQTPSCSWRTATGKNHRPDSAAREKEILGVGLTLLESHQPDAGDHRQVGEYHDDRDHQCFSPFCPSLGGSTSSRCFGHANLTSSAIITAARME